MREKEYSIYILECNDGSYYTGMTSDLDRRMISHHTCDELCSEHTRWRQPVRLVFSVNNIETGKLARAGEKYIKSLVREKKQKIIGGDEKMLQLLYKRIYPSS
ncbi:GIY-YIG nuclease family protein [Vibrio parahaemolyticus]|uniref:GIY-YIG nuclease family protein n=1 Tax=Vibrio parahaemolyticus TaxID=670 RepID=UPI00046EB7D0|nr:GIY-YIG nuclease family protein [Vibrio parahaemolyticus]ELB2200027.1 GIY-YIG nuclease family protein [Vibrio parahaemolyticus]